MVPKSSGVSERPKPLLPHTTLPQRVLHDPAFREAAGGAEWALEPGIQFDVGAGREGLGLSSEQCPSSCDYSAVPHPCLPSATPCPSLPPSLPPAIPSIICPHHSPPVCAPLHLSPAPSTFSPSWLEASTGEGSVLPTLCPAALASTHLCSCPSQCTSSPPRLPRPALTPPPPPGLNALLGLVPSLSHPPGLPLQGCHHQLSALLSCGPRFHLRPAPAHGLGRQLSRPHSACVLLCFQQLYGHGSPPLPN